MECALYNLELLFTAEAVEVHCISRYSYRERRIFFGMLHSVFKHLAVHYVDVEMVRALSKISVKNGDEIFYAAFVRLSEGGGYDGERVRDAVAAISAVWNLRNRVK